MQRKAYHYGMRALAYFKKGDVRFTKDLEEPKIVADDELIIDISWCGICGTDLHEYLDDPIFFPMDGKTNEISGLGVPQAIGHEMSGIVSKIGPGVRNLKVGDHVVVEPSGSCKDRYRWSTTEKPACAACQKGLYNVCSHLGLCGAGVQSGGCAERMCINESHCFKVPDNFPLDVAALIQPIAVCWHALRVCDFKKHSSVLIIGGGPIGLGMILALNGFGCTEIVVSEPARLRRELAAKMGAIPFDPSERPHDESIEYLRSIAPGGDGFDYTFDCSGLPVTLKAAVRCLTYRGTAVNVAMWGDRPVNFLPMDITKQEKRYIGSMCYTAQDFLEVIDAFDKKKIDVEKASHMITDKIPLEVGVEKGIKKLITHKDHTIKVIMTPNNYGELCPPATQ